MIVLLLWLPVLCHGFVNNWFPIVPISCTDFSNPKQIRILGKDYVLWKKDDQLVFQDDVCPHRCAPLSEGYIDKESKNLRCAYHGWEFNEQGACTKIPQMDKAFSQKNRERTCVKNYPTCRHGDLIWAFLGDNQTSCDPPPIKYNLQNTTVFSRDLPFSFFILLENFFDPAHIPFAHHKLQSTRDKAGPINVELLSNKKNNLSILFEEKAGKSSRAGFMTFEYPCHYFLKILKPRLNLLSGLHIFMVPIQEDKTRIFIKYQVNEHTRAYKIFSTIPIWLQHIFTNKFLDSDTLILHKQEQYLWKHNESYHHNKQYYMPTNSDKAIGFYKKWVYKHIPSIPFFYKWKENRELSRKEILNRYDQHTHHCKHCKKALKMGKILQKVGFFIFSKKFLKSRKPVYLVLTLANYFFFKRFVKLFVFEDYVHNEVD